MTAREEVGGLLVEQLQALDAALDSGEWLCCCGPAWLIDAEWWSYSRLLGWHDPSIQHAALWPVGGAP